MNQFQLAALPVVAAFVCFVMAKPTAGEDAADGKFVPYVNKSAGFRVSMPPMPQYNPAKIGDGPQDVQHQYFAGARNGVYMVAYQDHPNLNVVNPEVAEIAYRTARDGFRQAMQGQDMEYKEIAQGKLKGRETRFAIPARNGAARSRMFFANKRWYHVFVLGSPDFVNSKEAGEFLDSFNVVQPAVGEEASASP